MSGEKRNGEDSLERARERLEAAGPAPETTWDKESPTTPPNASQPTHPDWFMPILGVFLETIADEASFAELCLDRALKMVEEAHNRGMVGIDHFPEAAGAGAAPTRTSLVAAAMPWAVEFYKQCMGALSIPERTEKLKAAYNESMALRKLAQKQQLVLPPGAR